MGCNSSQPQGPAEKPKGQQQQQQQPQTPKLVQEQPAAPKKPLGDVKIYGAGVSMNCMGPVLLCNVSGCGDMEPCMPHQDTQKPEFLQMNPFGAVPLLKDKDTVLAETNTIMRYIAEKYLPAVYPTEEKRRGFVDWAMEDFTHSAYNPHAYRTIYVVCGFVDPPEKQPEANGEAFDGLKRFADAFLKEKFVGGDKPSLADYRAYPFFFAWCHPAMKKVIGFEAPDRIRQFNKDFAEACPEAVESMSVLKGYLDDKNGSPADLADITKTEKPQVHAEDSLNAKTVQGKGRVAVLGAPCDPNCVGAILFAKHTSVGHLNLNLPGDAKHAEQLAALGPAAVLPAMKDGDFCLCQPNAVLRYMASRYAPEYYPSESQIRGRIDWAMDRLSTGMYGDAVATIYAAMGMQAGSSSSQEELEAAGKKAVDNLQKYADFFLKEKFIAGESLSIADFKLAPFCYAWEHNLVKKKCALELPNRLKKFNQDFAASCKSMNVLQDMGGFAIKEMLDDVDNPSPKQAAVRKSMSSSVAVSEPPEFKEIPEKPTEPCACVVQ